MKREKKNLKRAAQTVKTATVTAKRLMCDSMFTFVQLIKIVSRRSLRVAVSVMPASFTETLINQSIKFGSMTKNNFKHARNKNFQIDFISIFVDFFLISSKIKIYVTLTYIFIFTY